MAHHVRVEKMDFNFYLKVNSWKYKAVLSHLPTQF